MQSPHGSGSILVCSTTVAQLGCCQISQREVHTKKIMIPRWDWWDLCLICDAQWIHSICIKQSWISFNWPKHGVISIRRWRLSVGGKSISLKTYSVIGLSCLNPIVPQRIGLMGEFGLECAVVTFSLQLLILFFNFAVIVPLEKNK